MKKTIETPCYKAYPKSDSHFKLLSDIFPDGIPVFYLRKIESKIINETIYIWQIKEDYLSEEKLSELYQFYSELTGWSVNQLKSAPLTIPNEFLSMVIDNHRQEVNLKWEYLNQKIAQQLDTNQSKIKIDLDLGTLQLINICLCRLIGEGLVGENMSREIEPLTEMFTQILGEEIKELKEYYKVIKATDFNEAIKELKL